MERFEKTAAAPNGRRGLLGALGINSLDLLADFIAPHKTAGVQTPV